MDLLGAAIRAKNPALAKRLEQRFAAVLAALETLRRADGSYPSYKTVDDAERKQLTALVAALAKPVAQVSGVLGS